MGKNEEFLSALAYRATNGELRNLIFLRLSKRYLEPKTKKSLPRTENVLVQKYTRADKGLFWTRSSFLDTTGQTLRTAAAGKAVIWGTEVPTLTRPALASHFRLHIFTSIDSSVLRGMNAAPLQLSTERRICECALPLQIFFLGR